MGSQVGWEREGQRRTQPETEHSEGPPVGTVGSHQGLLMNRAVSMV